MDGFIVQAFLKERVVNRPTSLCRPFHRGNLIGATALEVCIFFSNESFRIYYFLQGRIPEIRGSLRNHLYAQMKVNGDEYEF